MLTLAFEISAVIAKTLQMRSDKGFFSLFRGIEATEGHESTFIVDPGLEFVSFGVNPGWQRSFSMFRVGEIAAVRDFAQIFRSIIATVMIDVVERGFRPLVELQKPDNMRQQEKLVFDSDNQTPVSGFLVDAESADTPEQFSGFRIMPKLVSNMVKNLFFRSSHMANSV